MTKTAFVFPGQGSQYVGMGRDLYDAYDQARAVFEEADAVLGFALSELCFEGPQDVLTDTINAQPAILTVGIACLRALEAAAEAAGASLPSPVFTAGHSLGEYSAFVAAGALTFADAVRLTRERGRLMKEAGDRAPGSMAAVLNLEAAVLEEICRAASQETGGVVQVANYNSPDQIAISGDKPTLEKAMALAQERGARRVIPLPVSAAFHSPLIEPIVDEFRQVVEKVSLQEAAIPVVANARARPLTRVEDIKQEMVAQLTAAVRWTESVQYMIGQGVTRFVEIGPKDVLTGLIRRTDKSVERANVGDVGGVEAFLES